jgi:hypothetical protein
MRPIYRTSLKALVWIAAIVAGWDFLGDWWAPDSCLDFGGAFDYVNWRCSYDGDGSLPYDALAVYRRPSLFLFVGLLALAIALQVALRGRRAGA